MRKFMDQLNKNKRDCKIQGARNRPNKFDLAVELWLPLQTALPVAEGDRLRVFLNNTPMAPYSATVDYVTTEPQRRSDGTMGFKGRAHFSDTRGIDIELLGQQGVGRINTGTETLFMKFVRQPLVWLRQSLGI
jgi:hypothetical protein